jgi:hypothetical protein
MPCAKLPHLVTKLGGGKSYSPFAPWKVTSLSGYETLCLIEISARLLRTFRRTYDEVLPRSCETSQSNSRKTVAYVHPLIAVVMSCRTFVLSSIFGMGWFMQEQAVRRLPASPGRVAPILPKPILIRFRQVALSP